MQFSRIQNERGGGERRAQSAAARVDAEQMRRCPVQQAACTSRRPRKWAGAAMVAMGVNSLGQSRSARSGRHVASVRAGCSSVAVQRVG